MDKELQEEVKIEPALKEKKPELVQIDKETLANIVKQLEENKKTIEMLSYAADKGRVARWESSHLGEKQKSVSLHVDEDLVIVSWRVIKDERTLDPRTNAQVGEYQEIEVVHEDGTKRNVIGYTNFANLLYSKEIPAKVIAETKEYDGTVTFKVLLPNDKELFISSRYVN